MAAGTGTAVSSSSPSSTISTSVSVSSPASPCEGLGLPPAVSADAKLSPHTFGDSALTRSDPLHEWVWDPELEPSDELPLDELSLDDDSLDIYLSELHTKNPGNLEIVKKRKEQSSKVAQVHKNKSKDEHNKAKTNLQRLETRRWWARSQKTKRKAKERRLGIQVGAKGRTSAHDSPDSRGGVI
jgi:hypothetical protein